MVWDWRQIQRSITREQYVPRGKMAEVGDAGVVNRFVVRQIEFSVCKV